MCPTRRSQSSASTLFGRLHRLHETVGERFLRDIEEMSWTDIQKGAIGIGIFTDKLLRTPKGAQGTINVNDNRGQDRRSVNFTFGPKADHPIPQQLPPRHREPREPKSP